MKSLKGVSQSSFNVKASPKKQPRDKENQPLNAKTSNKS